MFKDEADFEEIVGRLDIAAAPNPEHRENLRQKMLSTFVESSDTSRHRTYIFQKTVKVLMKNPLMKSAAAAAVIIAALIGIHSFYGPIDGTTRAWAEVTEAVKNVVWMHSISDVTATMKADPARLEKERQETWTCFESKIAYRLISGQSEYIDRWDFKEGKRYTYNPHTNTIVIHDMRGETPIFPKTPFEYSELLTQVQLANGAELTRRTGWLNKTRVDIWEIVGPSDGGIANTRLFIDARTHLPIAHKTEYTSQGDTVEWNTKLEYPEDGPDSIYALGVPRTAEIIDKTEIALAKGKNESKLVALDIQLPRPMFVGTPQDTKVPNLEKPLGHPRPPFLAPVGTTNVALGKPVSSSDDEPIIGELEMIADGGKEAADGSYVELGPMLQHITIDLEGEHTIYAVVIWHYHKQARVYFDTIVQVADDPDFVTNVRTVFNNDIDNSAGLGIGGDLHYRENYEGKLIDAKGVKARYVRLYSNGNSHDDLNHYIEVEVYGITVK